MTTRVFHDLLDHTTIFLVVEHKATQHDMPMWQKFSLRVGNMNFAQDHKPLGKTRNNWNKGRAEDRETDHFVQDLCPRP